MRVFSLSNIDKSLSLKTSYLEGFSLPHAYDSVQQQPCMLTVQQYRLTPHISVPYILHAFTLFPLHIYSLRQVSCTFLVFLDCVQHIFLLLLPPLENFYLYLRMLEGRMLVLFLLVTHAFFFFKGIPCFALSPVKVSIQKTRQIPYILACLLGSQFLSSSLRLHILVIDMSLL